MKKFNVSDLRGIKISRFPAGAAMIKTMIVLIEGRLAAVVATVNKRSFKVSVPMDDGKPQTLGVDLTIVEEQDLLHVHWWSLSLFERQVDMKYVTVLKERDGFIRGESVDAAAVICMQHWLSAANDALAGDNTALQSLPDRWQAIVKKAKACK